MPENTSPFVKQRPIPIVIDEVEGLEIARNRVPGLSFIDKFGTNEAVPDEYVDIWDGGGDYNWITSATALTVVSDSLSDSASGAGARTLTLSGLDENWEEISEDVILDSSGGVSTVNSFIRIHRMIVKTAGSADINKGTIQAGTGTITDGALATANVNAVITPDHGQTLMAVYTVPGNKKGYMKQYYAMAASGKQVEIEFMARPDDGAWNIKHRVDLLNNAYVQTHPVPHYFAPKTDIRVRAEINSLPTSPVSAGFHMILVNKEMD
jgi:hypothetical protein